MTIQAVVFDLGGVLVELNGPPLQAGWLTGALSYETCWLRWLQSPSAQALERGELSVAEFAPLLIDEFKLNVSEEDFIRAFIDWPVGFYPGALELVEALQVRTAVLSNVNDAHWHKIMIKPDYLSHFDHLYASHLLGLAKPGAAVFEAVLADLNLPASKVVFFDDNQINVDSATALGILAYRVDGVDQCRVKLSDLGLLPVKT